jgi:DSBA-like thioredoxin domain-containing protein
MRRFAVTHDYLCPFARNGAEVVVRALEADDSLEVGFRAFSLSQVHLEEGAPPVWQPGAEPASGVLALQWGLAVRDELPERFPAVHLALFAARHDQGLDLRDPDVVGTVLTGAGLDAEQILAEVADGKPRETFRNEHQDSVRDHQVFGVPTVIAEGQAVFIRLLDRPGDDAVAARLTVERCVDLTTGWPNLNEFKHTSIPH